MTADELNKELMEEIRGSKNPPLPPSPFTGKEDDEWNRQKERDNQVHTDEDNITLPGTLE